MSETKQNYDGKPSWAFSTPK